MFYEGKTVLVTGGTGLIGTFLVDELLKLGAKVRVPIHQRQLNIEDNRIETFKCDLMVPEDCQQSVMGVDYVFHAAGAVGSAAATPADAMKDITTNLMLTSQMLHAAWKGKVKRFCLVSSSTVYPPTDYPVKEDEAWSADPYEAYLGYGWMKRYLEKLADYVASESELQIAIVRSTAVYGRWDRSEHVIPALIKKAIERQNPFEVWGTGDEVRDFFHASDLARGCIQMLEHYPMCDPVNIGHGSSVRIKDVAGIILEAAGYGYANIVFNASKPTTLPIRMVDTTKAEKVLGFRPKVSLEDGLRDTVKWYLHEIYEVL